MGSVRFDGPGVPVVSVRLRPSGRSVYGVRRGARARAARAAGACPAGPRRGKRPARRLPLRAGARVHAGAGLPVHARAARPFTPGRVCRFTPGAGPPVHAGAGLPIHARRKPARSRPAQARRFTPGRVRRFTPAQARRSTPGRVCRFTPGASPPVHARRRPAGPRRVPYRPPVDSRTPLSHRPIASRTAAAPGHVGRFGASALRRFGASALRRCGARPRASEARAGPRSPGVVAPSGLLSGPPSRITSAQPDGPVEQRGVLRDGDDGAEDPAAGVGFLGGRPQELVRGP